jgi:hypothetical protein
LLFSLDVVVVVVVVVVVGVILCSVALFVV